MSIHTALKTLIGAILVAGLTSGCSDPNNQQKLDRLIEDVEDVLSTAKNNLQQMAPSATQVSGQPAEEIEKLFTYEYIVKDFDERSSAQQIARELSILGEDRWECFDVQRVDLALRVFCKRKPKTYLRYLPGSLRPQ